MPLAVRLSITRMPGSVLGVLLRVELLAHACTGSIVSARRLLPKGTGATRNSDLMSMLSRRCNYALGRFIAGNISTLRSFGRGGSDVVFVVSPIETCV